MTRDEASAAHDQLVPILEIGGTHVTTAWATELGQVEVRDRVDIDNGAPAEELLAAFVEAGRGLAAPAGDVWGVAVPGPFDYAGGIGDFRGVDKFGHLHGVDVGAALREGLAATEVHFINDADAFGVGEWMAGALRGTRRGVGITIGTGIGSAFIDSGVPVVSGPDVPTMGEVHTVSRDGVPLEELCSRGALREIYRSRTGRWWDVKEIAEAASAGDPDALATFDQSYADLAEVLTPVLRTFGAEALVLGGSIAQSTELVDRFFTARLTAGPGGAPLPVSIAVDPVRSAIVGAAHWVHVRSAGAGGY